MKRLLFSSLLLITSLLCSCNKGETIKTSSVYLDDSVVQTKSLKLEIGHINCSYAILPGYYDISVHMRISDTSGVKQIIDISDYQMLEESTDKKYNAFSCSVNTWDLEANTAIGVIFLFNCDYSITDENYCFSTKITSTLSDTANIYKAHLYNRPSE